VIWGAIGAKTFNVSIATAFVAECLDKEFKVGIKRAGGSIDSGRAREKLHALIDFTQHCRVFVRNEP